MPADMTYPEWKEKFVEGGDKSGLKTAVKSQRKQDNLTIPVSGSETSKKIDSTRMFRYNISGNISDNNTKKRVIISDKQFGKKIGKHASDYGLSPNAANDRKKMLDIIKNIVEHSDETRIGE